jgi:hypothetical protein
MVMGTVISGDNKLSTTSSYSPIAIILPSGNTSEVNGRVGCILVFDFIVNNTPTTVAATAARRNTTMRIAFKVDEHNFLGYFLAS